MRYHMTPACHRSWSDQCHTNSKGAARNRGEADGYCDAKRRVIRSMLLMEGTAATETMMNRLHHRPMRGGVSRVGERFVSAAPGQVICRTGYLVAIMALSQKGMRNENTVKGLEASVESASRRSRRLPLSMMVVLMNVGVMNSRRTCFKKRSRWWSWRLVFLCFITPVNFVFDEIIPLRQHHAVIISRSVVKCELQSPSLWHTRTLRRRGSHRGQQEQLSAFPVCLNPR